MNSCNFIGNITHDLEIKFATNAKGTPVMKFRIAVRRDKDTADFINCVAFNKTAELIADYFGKGSTIGVSGKLQTGSYDNKQGTKVYTTELMINDITFVDKKNKNTESNNQNSNSFNSNSGVTPLDDGETPF